MYPLLLGLHNLTRWLVLLAGVAALVTAYWGLFAKRDFGGVDKATGVAFTALFGLQVVLGLVLYFVGPWGIKALPNLDAAEGGARVQIIFFSMYHITFMLVALVVAQLGYSLAKRAATGRQAFRRAALGYTFALVLVFAAIPWGIRPNWRNLALNISGPVGFANPQHLALAAERAGAFVNLEADPL